MPNFISSVFSVYCFKSGKKPGTFLLGFFFFLSVPAFADTTFIAGLNGTQSVPVNSSNAAGAGTALLNAAETHVTVTLYLAGLSGPQTAANIHGQAPRGRSGPAIFSLPNGGFTQTFTITPAQATDLKAGLWYFNVSTSVYPGGEIRGQIDPLAAPGFSGLAGWFRGESNAADTSFNTNDGILQNGASFRNGRIGQAFSFDGVNDFIEVPDSAALNITGPLSLQAWLNTSNTAYGKIAGKRSGGSDGYSLEVSNGKLRVRIGAGSFQSHAEIYANTWTHVAATYDGARIRIYINGLLNGVSPEITPVIPANSAPLRIGADSAAAAEFFTGLIDELQIHNRALSPAEIIAGYSSIPAPNSNGNLDTTFDSDGIVVTQTGPGNNFAQAVAVQADGKIVVAGVTGNGMNNDFCVVRYNPDGTLDDTFDGANSGNGIVNTPVGPSDDSPLGMSIQPDGKIIVVGQVFNGSNNDFGVVRYNPNGTLDTSFDGDGIVITPIGPGSDIVRSVVVQPDGKIVAAGNAFNGSNSDFAVVRYEANGSLDTSFDGNSGNGNGIVTVAIGVGNEVGYGVAMQRDGKIVVSGYYANVASTDTALLRFDQNGVLDPSFDSDGIVSSTFSPDTDEALSLALQPDGKIVIAGCIRNGAPNDFLLARYNENGSLDTAFGGTGFRIIPIGPAADIALSVALQPDGKIVAAGFSSNGSNNDFGVVRVNANGSLDNTFGGDGRVTTALAASTDSANAVAIQADGKIIVVGRTVVGSAALFGVTRYGYGTNAAANDGYFALDGTSAIRFDNAFRSGTTTAKSIASLGLPTLPAGMTLLNTPRVVLTSAGYAGGVLVKLTLPLTVDLANFNAAQVLQFENGVWIDRTTAAPARDFASRTIFGRISPFSSFSVVSPLSTASESVSVTGRMLRGDGRGVSKAIVTISDANGVRTSVLTNPFGYYRFTISARTAYLLNTSAKQHNFAPIVFSAAENIKDFDFVAEP
ncbi:MAG: LamG-like jellyroll fold domain-containing protein [Pyrinomonadaceae bacterium]